MAYNPSLFTVAQKSLGPSQSIPLDARSWYYDTVKYKPRPYISRAEVLAWLNTATSRGGQFPIIINTGGTISSSSGALTGGVNIEWWFKDGVADVNLVQKTTAVTGVGSFNNRTGAVMPASGDYTATMIGLGEVNNTSDLNKVLSIATQSALDLRVVKVNGKELINTTEVTRLASVQNINLIQGSNISITGSYPNITVSSSATGGSGGSNSITVEAGVTTFFIPAGTFVSAFVFKGNTPITVRVGTSPGGDDVIKPTLMSGRQTVTYFDAFDQPTTLYFTKAADTTAIIY